MQHGHKEAKNRATPAVHSNMRDMINHMKSKGLLQQPKKAPLGSGERFSALKSTLSKRKGVTNPGALAAYIGRKKYGAKKFASLGSKGKK